MTRPLLFLLSLFYFGFLTGSAPVRAQVSIGERGAAEVNRRLPAGRYGTWELASETRSPGGWHQTWRPTAAGRWLWPTTVRLTLPHRSNGRPTLRVDQLRPLDSLRLPRLAPPPHPDKGAVLMQAWLSGRLRPSEHAGAVVQPPQPVWYEADSARHTLRAGWLVTWGHPHSAIGAWEVLLDEASGQAAAPPRELLCYYHASRPPGPRDTTAVALVFRPDPLTTAAQPYGRPYIDSLDTDRPALNQQRVPDTLFLTWDRDSLRLRNRWFEIAEFDPPVRPVVAARTAAGLQFTRAQAGFQQVNALFHLTKCRAYVDKLGFGGLLNRRIRVDVSGLGGADQSRFSPVDTTLAFGEGGVDDAEDADVLTHELSHALAFGAAPNTNVGLERRTLDEANADYWAAVHSARLGGPTAYGREQVYNWDGHNEFWSGRWVISPKLYPSGLMGSIYRDADVWSSTLWQIRGVLTDSVADRLWLQHLYGYSPNLTMPEAARLLLQADSLLYGAAHADTIYHFFDERHILGHHVVVGTADPTNTALPGVLTATDAFARGDAARFRALAPTELALLTVTGQVVWRQRAAAQAEVLVPGGSLPPGVYVLRLTSAQRATAARLLRQ